jgi:hypothetical protein
VENKNTNIYPENLSGGDTLSAPSSSFNFESSDPNALTQIPMSSTDQAPVVSPINAPFWQKAKFTGLIAGFLLLLGGVGLAVWNSANKGSSLAVNPADKFGTTSIPLDQLDVNLGVGQAETVAINGGLNVDGAFVLTPSVQPSNAQTGQIYYDQTSNELAYYNGSEFVNLGGGGVQSLGGLTGQIALGAGLTSSGGQISNSGVTSLQGQTGDITLTAGSGIVISGTTISATGGGTITSSGGTSGSIPIFTTSQNIEDSIISQSGGAITIGGSLNLATPLSVPSGGTGTNNLTANGVLVGNGLGPITSVTSAAPGECLISTAGAPAFAACPGGGGGGVSSLNGQTGIVNLANATGSLGTVTIDDASTTTKGIAQFNSTNFTGTGTINTIQDIHTGASPTFVNQTLSGDLAVNGGDITSSSALNVSSGGAGNITLNSAGTIELQDNTNITGNLVASGNATLQGGTLTVGTTSQSGSLVLNDGSSNTGVLSVAALGQNTIYTLPDSGVGTATVCLTIGNCAGSGSGVTTAGGTTNRLSKFTGPQAVGDSNISDDGTNVTTTLDLIIQGGEATLGVASTQTGTLNFAHSGSANIGSLVQGTLTGSRTYTLPDATGIVCLSSGNCVGGGGGAPNAAAYLTVGNDATLSNERAVAVNVTNLTATDGGANGSYTINTVQDIATTSNPTFNSLTLNGTLGVTGTTTLSGDLNANGTTNTLAGTTTNITSTTSTISGTTTNLNSTNLALGDANTDLLTITAILQGANPLVFEGSTANTNELTLAVADPTADRTLTLPNETGTICTTGSICSGYQASGSYANTSLSNLSSVAINTTLLPNAAGTIHLGSTTLPFGDLFLAGTSGTPATNDFRITGTSTSGTRTITLPDATGTVCLQGSSGCGFAPTTGGAGYIQNQSAVDQTADFRISGTGRANTSLLTPTLDTPVATTLSLGTTTANAISIGQAGVTTTNAGALAISQTLGVTGTTTLSGDLNANGTTNTLAGTTTNLNSANIGLGDASTDLLTISAVLQGASPFVFEGATADTSELTIALVDPTADRTITLPDATGTVCLQSSAACGFAPTTGGTGYIQNQIASPQTSANFNIDGEGRAVTLNATTALQTAGTTRIENDGDLVNIGNLTATGAITIASTGANNDIIINGADILDVQDAATFASTLGVTGATTLSSTLGVAGTTILSGDLAANGTNADINSTNIELGDTNTDLLTITAILQGTNALIFEGTSADANELTLAVANPSTDQTVTLPDATGTVCLQGSSGCGFATGSGAAFVQNGNSFTTAATLGTNDAFDLNIERGGTTQLTVGNGNITLASNVDLLLQGASAYISNPQGQTASEAFGLNAAVSGSNALAVGNGAVAAGGGVALGQAADAIDDGVAIGRGAGVGSGSFGGPVSIGQGAIAASWGVAIGSSSATNGNWGTAVGQGAITSGQLGTALGNGADAGLQSVAIGADAISGGNNRIVIGFDTTATANNQLVIGGPSASGSYIDDAYFGSGVTDATPQGVKLNATGGFGTDIAGASLTLAGGRGTGTGAGGSINLQIADPGSSGSSLNALATVLSLQGTNGAATFQNTTDSAAAFSVLNVASNALLTVDSETATDVQNIRIGDTGTANAPVVLVLDHEDADPTGVAGAMYYQTGSNTFRCFATSWGNCASAGGTTTLQDAYNNDSDGSDAIIALSTADDSLILRNPASSGTDSGYILSLDQLNTGAVDGLRISTVGTGVGESITLANTSGTQTNGMLINRNAGGGTTTNGLNITQSAGTLTNGLAFSGTIGTDINRSSGSLSLNGNTSITLAAGGATKATVGANNVTLATNIDLLLQGASAYISNQQTQTDSEAFGLNAQVSSARALAVGVGADSTTDGSISLGYATVAQDTGAIAIGAEAAAVNFGSIAIGAAALTTANNQLVIGADDYNFGNSMHISQVVIGDGVTSSTPNGFTLQGTSGSGTDIAGASVAIAGGQGTGTGNGGSLNFQIADPGSTGTSLNSLATVLSLSGTNGSALFQNTTDSATALRIQNAAGTETVLNVDTTVRSGSGGNLIKIGNSTGTDGATTILQLDAATADPTSNLSALNGGLFYNSTTNKVSIIENGAVKILCNTTDLGCGTGTPRLDTIQAATGAGSVQDSNANSVFWNWDFTSAGADSGLTISESTASTSGTQDQQALLKLTTLSGSTASPLQVTAAGTDVADVWIDLTNAADFIVRDAGTAALTVQDNGLTVLGNTTTTTHQLRVQAASATGIGGISVSGGSGTTGGVGGGNTIAAGAGGSNSSNSGGSGGTAIFSSGQGGSYGGSSFFAGGNGGQLDIISGNGGQSTSTDSLSSGGTGGALNVTAGTGGNAASGANSGMGGTITISGGTGGAGVANNGVGGDVIIQGGVGSGTGAGGSVIVAAGTDSASSFQVQNAASVAIFTADTETATDPMKIRVGDTSTAAAPVLFVLDQEDADPTGVAGAMYFQTGSNTFRCYTTSWGACAGAGSSPFTSSGGIIDKTTIGDALRLLYGDAGDTQFTIENTTNNTIPTVDVAALNLTGNTTGIVQNGVDILSISAEFGDGTANTNSGIHLILSQVDGPSGDETYNGILIDSFTASSATERGLSIGTGWDDGIFSQSTITVNPGTAGSGAGDDGLVVTAGGGASGGTNAGGIISLTSGAGGNNTTSTSGAGGAINFTAGASGATTGSGNTGNGGAITLTTGTAGNSNSGNAGNGGALTLISGNGGLGTGTSGSQGGDAGDISITSGDGGDGGLGGVGVGGDGGDIVLTAGIAASGGDFLGSDGKIILNALGSIGNVEVGQIQLNTILTTIESQLQVRQADDDLILTVDTAAGEVELGFNNDTNGVLAFNSVGDTDVFRIQAPGAAFTAQTWTLPTALASTGQCLTAGTVSAPNVPLVWASCGGGSGAFTSGSGIITKTTGTDQLELRFDAAALSEYQLKIENTTAATAITGDAAIIDLTGGTGIITDNVDGLYVHIEGADGTSTDVSALHLDFDPVTGSADDTFSGLLIDGITGTSAVEYGINIVSGWDRAIAANGVVTIGNVSSATAQLHVIATNGSGAAGTNGLNVQAGAGGTHEAYVGGSNTIISGNGGTSNGSGSGLTGTGGALTLSAGNGGAGSGAALNSGTGGAVSITSGSGGTNTSTNALSSGAGGLVSIVAGAGANHTSDSALTTGSGGSINLTAGAGGDSAGALVDAGVGGTVTITAGTGGDATAGGQDGAAGNIVLMPGLTAVGSGLGGYVQIGSSTTDNDANLLILDSYNTTDPTGTAGAMYYSTSTNSFRCFGGASPVWGDCGAAITFTSGDGAGGTSNGSGLELGTGGFGLLQGCADGEVLKWTESSSVWGCGADAGAGTSPFGTSGGVITKTTASDALSLLYGDAGDVQFEIDNTGGSTVPTVDAMQILLSGGSGITTDGVDGLYINIEGADGTNNAVSGLRVDFDPISGSSGDTFTGIRIDDITGTNASEYALRIGTGWSAANGDAEVILMDASPIIKLGATDNTAILSITDTAATPNTLFELRDYNTNVGGVATSGAFIDTLSYFDENWNNDATAALTADNALQIGDNGGTAGGAWYFDTTGTTVTYSVQDNVGGFARIATGTTSGVAGLIGFGSAQNNLSTIWNKANMPVVQMKIRTGSTATTNDVVWGLSATATATATNDTLPAEGIFFWGNNGTSWVGTVRSGGANVGTPVTCPGSISTTQFAIGRIQVENATTVRFLMDNDVSNGVQFSDCGTVTTAGNPSGNLGVVFYAINTSTTSVNNDIDYVRIWQDDAGDASASAGNEPIQAQEGLSYENQVGMIDFQTATGDDPIFNNDVYIRGTLFTDKIRANQIEGLEIYTDKLSSLQQQLDEQQAATDDIPAVASASTATLEMEAMSLNLAGGLVVGGDAEFHGNAFFYKFVTFVEKTVFKNDITIAGHVGSSGTTLTAELEPAAGVLAAATVDGNDVSGQFTLNLGDEPGTGAVLTLKFAKPYTKAPNILLTPANDKAGQVQYYVQSTTDGFKLFILNAQTPGTSLEFNYWATESAVSSSN